MPSHDPRLPSRRLAHELREAISSGELEPGDRLPSERSLAATHGVARNTAREAIRLLAEEGLVTAEHGRGVFVRARRRLLRFGSERYAPPEHGPERSAYRDEVAGQGRTARVDCTAVGRTTPPPEVAERLGVDPGGPSVLRREDWFYADDEPVQIAVAYIPWEIAEGSEIATSERIGRGALHARFVACGHVITTVREEVSARMPTPDEAGGLAIPDGVPVLDVLHTGIDQQGRPFEVTRFVMRADLNGLDYRIPVAE